VLRLDTEKHRENWQQAIKGDALYLQRPAIFSSAAAAQDAANKSRMLWCWAPMWLPWEYTGWLDEGRSFHDTAYIGDWRIAHKEVKRDESRVEPRQGRRPSNVRRGPARRVTVAGKR
jgi:hypothetical protein